MKVLVAGATGAIGRQLVPRLIAAGHEVVGMARSASKRETLREMGASAVLADALVAEQVADAAARAQPEVIVHELTAIPETLDMRHFDRDFEMTNRLRTEGTDHLLSAGQAIGVRRFVAQSYTGWPFPRSGATVKTETDELDAHPVSSMRRSFEALVHLERAVTGDGCRLD
ncbi:MAG: NAD-dependent epimerase/dehydratase family protein [Jatrophihabitans sp.]